MKRSLATLALIVTALSLSTVTTAGAFDLSKNPERGPQPEESRNKPSESSPRLVESTPAETPLDLSSIPNTDSVWHELLSSATESIHLGMYYTNGHDRPPLESITSVLTQKLEQGIRVKVVSDSVFFSKYPVFLRQLARHNNGQVRILNLKDRTGGVMHAKYFVVDGRRYYVGSTNFSWVSLKHNRELGVSGENRAVADDLLSIFSTDWTLGGQADTEAWNQWVQNRNVTRPDTVFEVGDLPTADTPFIRVVASPPGITPKSVPSTLQTLLKLIRSARNEVFIDVFQYGLTSPYAGEPLTELDFALRQAALRGVKIHLLVSGWSLKDPQNQHLKSLVALPNVKAKYLSVPSHSDGYEPFSRVTHTKAMLVDGEVAWIGSENWQPGYFSESRNVGLVTNHARLTSNLNKYFLTAWTSSFTYSLNLNSNLEVPYHW